MRDKRGVTERHGRRDTGSNLPQKRADSLSNARARARPSGEEAMSRIKTVTHRDVTDGLRDSDSPALGPTRHHHDQRTAIANNIVEIARRVLENVALGRIYPQGTVEWAEHIVKTNTPPVTSRAQPAQRRARVFEDRP